MTEARRMAIYYGILATLVVVVGGAVWYRSYYNIWPGQDATQRVHWCERNYQDLGAPAQTWKQVTASSGGKVRAFGRYPPLGVPGQELYAATFSDAAPSSCSVAVYLRRGRALMGLYFSHPDAQPAIDGKTSIPDIVSVFAGRMAALPAGVVNA